MALQRVEAPAKRKPSSSSKSGDAARSSGLGTSGGITVKGRRATSRQRHVIDGCLTQAKEDGASRRVMVAVVMAITDESGAGEDMSTTGSDDTGIFQQGRNWISAAGARDPGKATHAFLVTGPTSWKKVHGGLKKAPGNLSLAIHQVQGNADPNAYAPFKKEAINTVDTWLGQDGNFTTGPRRKRYEFTRGERHGQKENSWDAAGRLVEEVGAYRWAAGNVLYVVSGDELRAGAPALTINGDESWLVSPPSWSWASGRDVAEVTLQVLTEHWNVMPGACVALAPGYGPLAGRFMVWNVAGDRLDSPTVTVVLRRPTRLRPEPAPETADAGGGGSASSLKAVCKNISEYRSPYVYGGSHGPKLSKMKSSDPMDCSSSVSLALHRAHMFKGDVAIVSGGFAKSYGKAGKGQDFTVWANDGHVWIEGYKDGKFDWRFDTSHHGGKSGPAFETQARSDQARFTPRHWPGM